MPGIAWTEKEFEDLVKTVKTCFTRQEAARKHNAKWHTGRSADSIGAAMERHGLCTVDCLKKPDMTQKDAPVSENIVRLVKYLKGRPSARFEDVCDALEMPPKRAKDLILKAREHNFQVSASPDSVVSLSLEAPTVDRLAVHRITIEPIKGHLVFGVASDLHCSSKLHRNECLHDFVDIAMEEYGVRDIFVPGDVHAGINMFPGQAQELEEWGLENQTKLAARQVPQRDDLTWRMISGNHDESLLKAAGADALKRLATIRPDIEDLGFYSRLIDLAVPGAKSPVKIELFHPAAAGAYALSYHVQKAIEQIPSGMKPQLLFCGHEHTSLQIPDYRGIAAFLCGCFEDQSLYLKRKHLQPAIGGWIIDIGVTSTGELRSLSTTWIKYLHSRRGSIQIQGSDDRMVRKIGVPGD